MDIDWDISKGILCPTELVEHWRLVLWDNAFRRYFPKKGEFKFSKGLNLMDIVEGSNAIKRVTYWYYFLPIQFSPLSTFGTIHVRRHHSIFLLLSRFHHRELVVKNVLCCLKCLPPSKIGSRRTLPTKGSTNYTTMIGIPSLSPSIAPSAVVLVTSFAIPLRPVPAPS